MKTQIEIKFKSDPVLLEAIRALIGCYFHRLGMSPERAQEVVLAVDEACTNAMRHGYDHVLTAEIILQLRRDEAGVEVVVSDEGSPMPESVILRARGKNKEVTPETVRPGGLGLKLIHHIFDEVEITTGEKRGNRVCMRLHLK
ncbi:MAG: ATP-binding protein [Candidatus Hydrogenedentes bacterium]|nr:ATP-binding protein [Candidatus Hydrogenedentota bacterium]